MERSNLVEGNLGGLKQFIRRGKSRRRKVKEGKIGGVRMNRGTE
jgi:hypothetical protein